MTDPTPPKGNPARAKAALLNLIEQQIESGDPPEVAQTLERLMGEAYSREDAIRLIASALMGEVYGAMKGGTYDGARYVRNLLALPKLPWETADTPGTPE
jgi:hypothetical protein